MDEQQVRERAEAVCAALVVGDVQGMRDDLSDELKSNLGEVLALLPLPATEATVESVEHGGGAAYVVVLRLVGESEEVRIQSRWKDPRRASDDRGGEPPQPGGDCRFHR